MWRFRMTVTSKMSYKTFWYMFSKPACFQGYNDKLGILVKNVMTKLSSFVSLGVASHSGTRYTRVFPLLQMAICFFKPFAVF